MSYLMSFFMAIHVPVCNCHPHTLTGTSSWIIIWFNGWFCPLNNKTETEALHIVLVLCITIMANCVCTYSQGNINNINNNIIFTQCKFDCKVGCVVVKAVLLQAWSGPESSRKLRFPNFMTTAQDGGKVVGLTHRPPLPPGNSPGTHFCWRLSRPQGHSMIRRILCQWKIQWH